MATEWKSEGTVGRISQISFKVRKSNDFTSGIPPTQFQSSKESNGGDSVGGGPLWESVSNSTAPLSARKSLQARGSIALSAGGREAAKRRSHVNVNHISRPGAGTHVLEKAKTPKGSTSRGGTQELMAIVGRDIAVPKHSQELVMKKECRIAPTPLQNESSITVKEEQLEQIMASEAHACFEQIQRYQLNKDLMTRVAVNPSCGARDTNGLDDMVTDLDLDHESEHCWEMEPDSSLVDEHPLRVWSASPADHAARPSVPEWMWQGCGAGLRVGFGFPPTKNDLMTAQHDGRLERLFAATLGDLYSLVGVVNGHGQPDVACRLVEMVAELLPEALFQAPPLVLGQNPAGAMVYAFHSVHCQAVKKLDLKLAGATATLALIDKDVVWVAHVGDCRAVLNTPDKMVNAKDFHYAPHALTVDHKLSAKGEFDRCQWEGGEARKLAGDNVYRLYVPGTDLPGLTLTRSLGNRIGHHLGVVHTPEVAAFRLSELQADGRSCFLVLGSGGLWSTMSEKTVANWISGHFSTAQEAAESLANEASARWQDVDIAAKASLHRHMADSFSTAVLFFDFGDTQTAISRDLGVAGRTTHKPFMVGPHTSSQGGGTPWHDTFKLHRSLELRKAMVKQPPLPPGVKVPLSR